MDLQAGGHMQKSALERFLGLFTDVRPGEGLTALMLATNIFLILTAYYIIKPVREGLILSGSGPEVKSYLAAVLVIVLIGTVKLFAWLAGRFSRKPLINIVTLFFVVCLAIFYFLGKFGLPYLDVIFFVWIGMFNVMIPAQFWGFANDIYTPDAGKRLMVLVAFGSNLGAIVGAKIASYLVGPVGLFELMLVAGGVLAISLLFTNAVDAREKSQVAETDQSDRSDEEPLGKEGAFKLVFQTKYLLMIALLILLLNWVNTTGEYILGRVVGGAADAAIAAGSAGGLAKSEYIGKFYADFFSIVNLGSVLIQLFGITHPEILWCWHRHSHFTLDCDVRIYGHRFRADFNDGAMG